MSSQYGDLVVDSFTVYPDVNDMSIVELRRELFSARGRIAAYDDSIGEFGKTIVKLIGERDAALAMVKR